MTTIILYISCFAYLPHSHQIFKLQRLQQMHTNAIISVGKIQYKRKVIQQLYFHNNAAHAIATWIAQ